MKRMELHQYMLVLNFYFDTWTVDVGVIHNIYKYTPIYLCTLSSKFSEIVELDLSACDGQSKIITN